jgi:hypothetical protein
MTFDDKIDVQRQGICALTMLSSASTCSSHQVRLWSSAAMALGVSAHGHTDKMDAVFHRVSQLLRSDDKDLVCCTAILVANLCSAIAALTTAFATMMGTGYLLLVPPLLEIYDQHDRAATPPGRRQHQHYDGKKCRCCEVLPYDERALHRQIAQTLTLLIHACKAMP